MLLVRACTPADVDRLAAVARHLDSVNLPDDRDFLAGLVDRSQRALAADAGTGEEVDAAERNYLFAAVDADDTIVGTSMILAKHGTHAAPHAYFDVIDAERYSASLGVHVRDHALRLGFDYDGPTEIGGLVVHPDHRRSPQRPGKLLSLSRFGYLAARRARFESTVLAELMPPLTPEGDSPLWHALGARLTGLCYREADRLSHDNKEFIRTLFPETPIPVSILPEEARAVIGTVGPATRGAERMLTAIGFRYSGRVDPFDGGPHFVAETDRISLVADARWCEVRPAASGSDAGYTIVCAVRDTAPRFRAVGGTFACDDGAVALDDDARRALAVEVGERVLVVPTGRRPS